MEKEEGASGSATGSANPWAALLEAGAAVLGQLAAPTPGGTGTKDAPASFVRTDEKTGETYLRCQRRRRSW